MMALEPMVRNLLAVAMFVILLLVLIIILARTHLPDTEFVEGAQVWSDLKRAHLVLSVATLYSDSVPVPRRKSGWKRLGEKEFDGVKVSTSDLVSRHWEYVGVPDEVSAADFETEAPTTLLIIIPEAKHRGLPYYAITNQGRVLLTPNMGE